jgi:hypothetical protein
MKLGLDKHGAGGVRHDSLPCRATQIALDVVLLHFSIEERELAPAPCHTCVISFVLVAQAHVYVQT